MGHSPKSENYTSNPNDYILVQGNADILNGWVSPRVWTTQVTSLAPAGSILISVRAPVGNVGKTAHNVVIGRGMAAIEGDEFIFQLLSKMHIEKYWKRVSTGSTFESINSKDIKEALIKLPDAFERESIGNFLKTFDEYISLHQRKIQALQKTKVLYLQKMLANKEQKRPHLRFKTFQDSWQNYKLKNIISTEFKGKATARMSGSQSLYLDTNYLNGGEALFVDCATNIDKDDVIILWDGSQAGKVYHGFVGALGSTLKAFRPLYSGAFIYYQLLKNQERIYNNYRTPNIPHVIKSFSEEFLIPMGSQKEQNSISDFFNTLDHDIKYYKEKVNILVKLKVIYLKKMFI